MVNIIKLIFLVPVLLILSDPTKFIFISLALVILLFTGPITRRIGSCGTSSNFLVDIVSFSLIILTL